MSLGIAFIGYGEVGQLFARQLAARPGVRIAVYDILFEDPGKGPQLRQRAREAGVQAASDLGELCRDADIVISAVTADAAVAVAGQAAPHLTSSQVYIDLNSISPPPRNRRRNRSGSAARSSSSLP